MRVADQHYQTIWLDRDDGKVFFIDQALLPFVFSVKSTKHHEDLINAIKTMQVRGAPVIGITGALALLLGMVIDSSNENLNRLSRKIIKARPTAVNLAWAVNSMNEEIQKISQKRRLDFAWNYAEKLIQNDIQCNHQIGIHGGKLISDNNYNNILTHCNAGWLATVDHGTALSPIYEAFKNNQKMHVWVDETRPRNQGLLTCWELMNENIPYTLIVDNAGGLLMMEQKVDVVIVGADRISINGHVCNKIGTYLKALAAKANNIPFYVAAPSSSIDINFKDEINFDIENRSTDEILKIQGLDEHKQLSAISFYDFKTHNPAFDVTPNHLITGIITEKGIFKPETLKKAYE